jgi:hypothetical protein
MTGGEMEEIILRQAETIRRQRIELDNYRGAQMKILRHRSGDFATMVRNGTILSLGLLAVLFGLLFLAQVIA